MNARYPSIVTLMLLGAGGILASGAEDEAVSIAPSTTQIVKVPQSTRSGSGGEVTILLDQSHLKIATISLRQGTAP